MTQYTKEQEHAALKEVSTVILVPGSAWAIVREMARCAELAEKAQEDELRKVRKVYAEQRDTLWVERDALVNERAALKARVTELEEGNVRRQVALDARIVALEARSPSAPDATCAECGEMTESLAGNPGRWRVSLPRSNAPGVMQAHHMQCVLARLAECDGLRIGLKTANEELKQLEKECAELKEHNEVLAKQVTELGERLDRCDDARIAVEVERDALKNSRDAANARSTECEPHKDAPAFPRVFPRSTVAALRTFVEQWAHWHPHADQTRSPVNAAACLVVELNQLLDG